MHPTIELDAAVQLGNVERPLHTAFMNRDIDERDVSPARPAVVGRLAPSPTGLLHLGHAFSLLVAWWHVRSLHGRVVLRIDDVDSERADPTFAQQMLDDLRWLGLDWDDVPRIASDNDPLHAQALQQLIDRGDTYPCVCSRGDMLRALGAPQAGATELRYPGTCRGKFATIQLAEESSGKPAALRLLSPNGPRGVQDLIYGWFEQDLEAEVGDFVVRRRQGNVAYQLGCVVDDDVEHVTHVVRGRDLLPSTLRQNWISERLGLAIPRYAHVPLICDHKGRRLAKRERDLSLNELRSRGTTATHITRWAARCAGQEIGSDQRCAQDFLPRFDLSRVIPADILLPEHVPDAFEEIAPRRLPRMCAQT